MKHAFFLSVNDSHISAGLQKDLYALGDARDSC